MEIVGEGMNQPIINPKRIKVEEMVEGGDDRISVLPDGLLREILSRLPTTKSAVTTGTLSKRWKYLWTSVHTLIFERYGHVSCPDFFSSVHKALTQCPQSKLKKFVVHTAYNSQFESQVSSWIRNAISCNVEKLDIALWNVDAQLLLNDNFFINSYFTYLSLRGCIFNPSGAISWKKLQTLCIHFGNLGVDLIENILSGCPQLETLVVLEAYGLWRLWQLDKSVKKLEFCGYRCPDGESESQVNHVIRFLISCNVEEIDLNFDEAERKAELDEDFFINPCFTNMTLSFCIFNPNWVIGWKELRSLYICTAYLDEDVIENMLSGSPLLETLELHDCYGYRQLDITSKSVKKLVYSQDRDHEGEVELADLIEINAPYILSLKIQGYLHLLKLLLSNVSSLAEANLDITKDESLEETTLPEEEMLKGFILSLRHVKMLQIGNYYSADKYKRAMLEEYKEAMLEKYNFESNLELMGSVSEEVQELKEKFEKMEHEHTELEAKQEHLKEKIQKLEHEQAKGEAEREQLKEEILKMKHEQKEQEAERVIQEAEQKAQDTQRESNMKGMQDKLKVFEELLLNRFPHFPPS